MDSDFLEHFPNRNFEVIFVTAHASMPYKPFEKGLFDYLLKPVDRSDLVSLLDRVNDNLLIKAINSATL